jgi:hypothetical protein
MMRVVRPGERIGLANWTPEGLVGQSFKGTSSLMRSLVERHIAPGVAGLKSWAEQARRSAPRRFPAA